MSAAFFIFAMSFLAGAAVALAVQRYMSNLDYPYRIDP